MKNGKLDRINLLKYLMVVLLIIYVVFLVTREGDNTVSVDTIEKNITKAVKLEGMKKGTTQDLKKYYRIFSVCATRVFRGMSGSEENPKQSASLYAAPRKTTLCNSTEAGRRSRRQFLPPYPATTWVELKRGRGSPIKLSTAL